MDSTTTTALCRPRQGHHADPPGNGTNQRKGEWEHAQAPEPAAAPEVQEVSTSLQNDTKRVTFSTSGTLSRSGRGSSARKLPNGDTYEGDWDKGRPHGRGSYTWVRSSPPLLGNLLQVCETSPCHRYVRFVLRLCLGTTRPSPRGCPSFR